MRIPLKLAQQGKDSSTGPENLEFSCVKEDSQVYGDVRVEGKSMSNGRLVLTVSFTINYIFKFTNPHSWEFLRLSNVICYNILGEIQIPTRLRWSI